MRHLPFPFPLCSRLKAPDGSLVGFVGAGDTHARLEDAWGNVTEVPLEEVFQYPLDAAPLDLLRESLAAGRPVPAITVEEVTPGRFRAHTTGGPTGAKLHGKEARSAEEAIGHVVLAYGVDRGLEVKRG